MLLDLKRMFSAYDAPVSRTLELDLSGEDFPGCTVPEPVHARVDAALRGDVVELALEIRADAAFECARCLAPGRRCFHVEKTCRVREADLSDPFAEFPFTPEGRLDLREFVYTELVLEIPPVLLCSDDCAGLCPVCGSRKPCSCRHETSGPVDERLSVLKQLLGSGPEAGQITD